MQPSVFIVGPCAAESEQQLREAVSVLKHYSDSHHLQDRGFRLIFRAGVWKPRTRPGNFEGVGEKALRWLADIEREYGIEVATEVATQEQVRLALSYGLHCLWIGARTTTNPFIVQQIADAINGQVLTLLVKNPVSPDLGLWEGAIQRLGAVVGTDNVMAVHRGFNSTPVVARHSYASYHVKNHISTISAYRNSPQWAVALALKKHFPDLPLLLDPSHLSGKAEAVTALSKQALEMGYNGLMIEFHPDPPSALSDKNQQLSPAQLKDLLMTLFPITNANTSHPVAMSPLAYSPNPALASPELAALRAQMDEIDDRLWQLVAERMNLSKKIGEYKKRNNIQVLQTARWQDVVTGRLQWASEQGLSEENVMQILEALHNESQRVQESLRQ